jgi:small subunit ribosomal protein S1
VTGVVTKIAPFGAFARIEDGIEGLIHLSELTPGTDPKSILHEGAQLQLRILRIDAERRRLGLSLRQADELDTKETPTENEEQYEEITNSNNAPSQTTTSAPIAEAVPVTPSLESLPVHPEPVQSKRDNRNRDRQDRPAENGLLGGIASEEGELTAMAEAFRAAARQRSSKEENDSSE